MKRLALQLSSVGTLLSAWATNAFALPDPEVVTGLSTNTDITIVILDIIKIVLDFVLILAVLFVIVAGIRLIASAGDEGEKEKAKKTVIYVIAGIIVILFARAIVVFINSSFT